jgi:hypothetical protein
VSWLADWTIELLGNRGASLVLYCVVGGAVDLVLNQKMDSWPLTVELVMICLRYHFFGCFSTKDWKC